MLLTVVSGSLGASIASKREHSVTSTYHYAIEDAVGLSQAGSIEEAAIHDVNQLASARGLVLGVMNRVLGIEP